MCRAGSGLGRRVLDSVFIFQMVMMKTRKIHEFFPTDLLNKTLISNQCENFPSEKKTDLQNCIVIKNSYFLTMSYDEDWRRRRSHEGHHGERSSEEWRRRREWGSAEH